MRSILIAATLFSLLSLPGRAQSPADGRVQGQAYVSSYFHYSYAWPSFLQPVPTTTLHLHAAPSSRHEFLLFAARQGNEQFGVVLIAEKLHFPTRTRPGGFNDGQDFLDWVTQWPDPTAEKILSRNRTHTPNGLTFDELDYLDHNQYTSAIATQVGQYLLVFRCNAKSKPDLEEMTKSILASRRLN